MKRWALLFILIVCLVIRVWDLSAVPNGFSWDEQDNVYQAYSLLKTGRDMFGNPLPVLLHSIADYKSSLYIYMTIPFVALGGMNILTAKTAAVLFGIISIVCVGVIAARKFKSIDLGIIAGIVMAISPWWFAYSRLSFEAVGMLAFFLLGVVLFPKKLNLAIIMFALSVWTYSTAKLFAPVFVLLLLAQYWRSLGLKKAIVAAALFGVLVLPVQLQTFFGKGGTRFNEIAVFTDPTTASQVNFEREEGQLGSGVVREVGMTPRLIDRIMHNKIVFWTNRLIGNYLQAFSTDFLFLRGDPNLRHSPGSKNIGQLHVTDMIFLVAGLVWLIKRPNALIAWWLLLAPLPSMITRDGGNHATRLLFMLPPLVLVITAGIEKFMRHKLALAGVMMVHLCIVSGFVYYYFSHYRFESARPFHWGFEQVIDRGLSFENDYDRVIFDFGNESPLMAFLVRTNYDPKLLQSQHPLSQTEVAPGYTGAQFGKVIILPPGSRTWSEMHIDESTMLILSDKVTLPRYASDTLDYPNGEDAFYFLGY